MSVPQFFQAELPQMALPEMLEPPHEERVPTLIETQPDEHEKMRRRKKKSRTPLVPKEEEVHADYETTRETMKQWMKETANASIVYGSLLRKSNRNLQRTLLSSFILSGIMTFLSGIIVFLGAIGDYQWVILGINCGILIGSSVIVILNALDQIYGWDTKVKKFTKMTEKLDAFWMTLKTEVDLSNPLRLDPDKYMPRLLAQYQMTMQLCSHVTKEECESALNMV